jgi:hypothetical protein
MECFDSCLSYFDDRCRYKDGSITLPSYLHPGHPKNVNLHYQRPGIFYKLVIADVYPGDIGYELIQRSLSCRFFSKISAI